MPPNRCLPCLRVIIQLLAVQLLSLHINNTSVWRQSCGRQDLCLGRMDLSSGCRMKDSAKELQQGMDGPGTVASRDCTRLIYSNVG